MQAVGNGVNDLDRVEGATSPILVDAHAYWASKCEGRRFPSRADLDPIEIPRLLPFVYLVNVLGGGQDFQYRLIGTDIVEKTLGDYTGNLLSEISESGSQRRLWSIYGAAATTGDGYFDRLVYKSRLGLTRWYENLVLPLSGDGETVDMLFGVAEHYEGFDEHRTGERE